jgi:DNA-binding transcriptional ArsR family regulator
VSEADFAARQYLTIWLTLFEHRDILNHMVLDRSPALDRVFHALAHPARRAILRRLTAHEQNLSELAAPLRMSFPAASKHVRVLERARLVRRRITGRSHLCRLDARPLKDVAEWTENYRQFWERRFEALDNVLAEMQSHARPSPRKPSTNRSHA